MITLVDGTTRVLVSANRGGMVTHFVVGSRSVLYLDDDSMGDPSRNVRGGVPVLFPCPGPLAGGHFSFAGKSGVMKQHGFARSLPWRVLESDARSVAFELVDNDTTRVQFPWQFALTYRYTVGEGRFRVEQRIENRSEEPMPFAAGFHPYFLVPDADKARVRIPTPATRAWDNVEKCEIALDGPIDLTKPEVDLHLVDHGSSEATLDLGDARVVISGAEAYRRWVVWTLRGKDFVCLEPWTAPANALNTGEGLRIVAPGARDHLFVDVALA